MKNVTNKTYLKRTDDQHEHYHGEIHHRFLSECQKKCGILLFLLHCGLQLVQMILASLSTDQMPNQYLNQSRLSQLRFPALQPVACFFFFALKSHWLYNISLCSDWRCSYSVWFWIYNIQSRSAPRVETLFTRYAIHYCEEHVPPDHREGFGVSASTALGYTRSKYLEAPVISYPDVRCIY